MQIDSIKFQPQVHFTSVIKMNKEMKSLCKTVEMFAQNKYVDSERHGDIKQISEFAEFLKQLKNNGKNNIIEITRKYSNIWQRNFTYISNNGAPKELLLTDGYYYKRMPSPGITPKEIDIGVPYYEHNEIIDDILPHVINRKNLKNKNYVEYQNEFFKLIEQSKNEKVELLPERMLELKAQILHELKSLFVEQ